MKDTTAILSNRVILLRCVEDVLLASKPRLQTLEELNDLNIEVLSYGLMFLHRLVKANDGDCVIPIDLHKGLANTVLEESLAVVVLVKDLDITGDDVKGIHTLDLFLLLLAFGDRTVLGKLVDVVQHLFFLIGKQIFQDLIDVLAEQKWVIFFGIVKDSN